MTRADPESVTWVAEIAARIVGFCQSGQAVPEAPGPSRHIHSLYIAPGFQGLGLGCALLERTTATIWAAGFPRATLNVFGFNDEAIRFYEHLGWRRIGTVQDMPIPGFLYELRLS